MANAGRTELRPAVHVSRHKKSPPKGGRLNDINENNPETIIRLIERLWWPLLQRVESG